MTRTIHVDRVRGKIDFAIITIREDEFEAILKRLTTRRPVVGGRQTYEYCRLRRPDGRVISAAAVRTFDQGQSVAQLVARDTIEDLAPRWLILSGIAGGIPDSDFSLGDVLLASRLHDFSVTAAVESDQPQFRPSGGPVHPAVERLLAAIPAYRDRLGGWNEEAVIAYAKPRVEAPDDIRATCYYGLHKTRESVRNSLQRNFPAGGTIRPPLFTIGTVATANVLLKDTTLLSEWRRAARDISHIEMEAGGVYLAARHARPHEVPLLCVRGISDIVGFSRTPEWTPFACHSAASLVNALLLHVPLELFDLDSRYNRPSLSETLGRMSRRIGWFFNVCHEAVRAIREEASDLVSYRRHRTPTIEAIIAEFAKSSAPLVARTVRTEDRIPRAELQTITDFPAVGDRRVLCVLGSPGSGKTAILALVTTNAIAAGVVTLAIKADYLPSDVSFADWLGRQLGLGISPLDAVRAASSRTRMLVVVDQLDALASTVDLHSDRLNDILEFIAQCAQLPNVSVITSCRAFDFTHDARFASLDATVLDLTLPSWDDVAVQLAKHGVTNAITWPPQFRDVLRTPQHLRVFLDRFATTGRTDVFGNYYLMLDDLWLRSQLTADENALLARLTQELVHKEQIWLPLARFDDCIEVIGRLESKGILATESGRVGFPHQTMLEHAKARYFTKHDDSLADYIINRQNAILIRPTAWAVLTYLRDVDPDKYRKELEKLFASDLRLHLRFLLVEFLGQISLPDDYEVVQLAERLSDNQDAIRALIAIRGKQEWFRALYRSHFPSVMRGPSASQWPMIGVIGDAWSFARELCLDLIEQNWLIETERDRFTYRALSFLGQWDERAVEMVCTLVKRATGEAWHWAETLVSTISADQPALAPRVFELTARRQLESVGTEETSSPLEAARGWYDLPAVAEAAPFEFLRDSWPWFVHVCERYHKTGRGAVLHRYTGMCFALDEHDQRPQSSVLTAFLVSIRALSASDPDAFLRITRPSWSSENAVLHRVIIQGLCIVVRARPAVGLEYLSGDSRRFFLGTMESNEQSDSQALIAAIASSVTGDDLHRLVDWIRSCSEYRDGVELEDCQREWDREARIRLLGAIPKEVLPPSIMSFVESEMAACPNWDYRRRTGRAGHVRQIPPVTREELVKLSDEDILATIRASGERDRSLREMKEIEGGWEEPGGPYSAGKEIAALVKENPQRALDLTLFLVHDGQFEAAEAALSGLADLPEDDVLRFIEELDSLGPLPEELRSKAGNVLYSSCRSYRGLPDRTCEMIRRWLSEPWDVNFGIVGRSDAEASEFVPDTVESVLWSSRHGIVDADRSLWPLLALTYGYLSRPEPETTKWLDAVAEHLERNVSERTWAAYCSEMRWIGLRRCDRFQGEAVVTRLFERYPRLQDEVEGIGLVANISFRLSAEFLDEFLQHVRTSRAYLARQGFGELLALVALRDGNHAWAIQRLDAELTRLHDDANRDEAVAVGIAFAAAHLWDECQVRLNASRVLSRIVPHANQRIGRAIGSVFWAREDFAADEATEVLFTALSQSPIALSQIPVIDLGEHLSALAPFKRRLVLEVCNAIIRNRPQETDLFEAGPHLVKVAMTLQRFSDTREGGLTLLESLLRMGLDDAFRMLRDIDIRPSETIRHEPRRRRRRR